MRSKTAVRLFSVCSHKTRLHPSDETVFDGHTCSSLSFLPVPRGSRKSLSPVRHGVKNARVALAELATATSQEELCPLG
jgi:hypothetical protein